MDLTNYWKYKNVYSKTIVNILSLREVYKTLMCNSYKLYIESGNYVN